MYTTYQYITNNHTPPVSELTETIFKAVASCLPGQVNDDEQEEEESLTQAARVQYFLEVN